MVVGFELIHPTVTPLPHKPFSIARMPAAIAPEGLVVDSYPAAHRSLRVAFVTETYPPEVNGVAMTMAKIVEGMHGRNHEVQLIRPRQDGGEAAAQHARYDEVLMRGLPIPRYPHLRMGVPSKRALVQLWALRRPDVVHIATEGALGWSALQAARHLKLPVCSDFRTNFHAYSKHYGVGWLHKPIMAYLRKFHNLTQRTMTPDVGLQRELQGYGFQNVVVVARGVDTAQFNPAHRSEALRQRWGVEPGDLVLVHVGRIAAEKNLATLADAYHAVRQRDRRARLLMVGDGPARKEFMARCPSAIWAGVQHGSELSAHYASSDLLLFPSLTETYGNVTPEAMASGLPVLAFDYAAAGRLVQPQTNGLLAPFGNASEFVRMAVDLAQDREGLRVMGRQARAATGALGWDRIVDSLESIYHALVQAAPAPRAAASGAGWRAQGA